MGPESLTSQKLMFLVMFLFSSPLKPVYDVSPSLTHAQNSFDQLWDWLPNTCHVKVVYSQHQTRQVKELGGSKYSPEPPHPLLLLRRWWCYLSSHLCTYTASTCLENEASVKYYYGEKVCLSGVHASLSMSWPEDRFTQVSGPLQFGQ